MLCDNCQYEKNKSDSRRFKFVRAELKCIDVDEWCGCTDYQNQQVKIKEISDEEDSNYNDDSDGSDIENISWTSI
jgi:hypothetical protein